MWLLALHASAQLCPSIDFEPDGNGLLPDGSVATDNLPITTQYLLSHGVSFGIDDDLDGVADLGASPALEAVGLESINGFFNNVLGSTDTAASGFESQLGTFFLRTPTGTGGFPAPTNLLITYTSPVSAASAEIWDLDGEVSLGSEQWRLEALDAFGGVLDSISTPEQIDFTFDGKPVVVSIDHAGISDIYALRMVFTGTKTGAAGIAFKNFNSTCSAGSWQDLGNALAGSSGIPALVGSGTLIGGDPVSLSLTGGLPITSAYLVIGLTDLSAPFKGGVLVPNPDIVVSGIPLDTAGDVVISDTWPTGVSTGFVSYFQFWIPDPGGPSGFAASNAVSGTTP
jgi:hypothetical protein